MPDSNVPLHSPHLAPALGHGRWLRVALGLAAAVLGTAAASQGAAPPCGDLRTHYGPYDYRTDRHRLGIVEQYHFTPPVETLTRGQNGTVAGDLDYTLKAFPNHHRALLSVSRMGERPVTFNTTMPEGMSVDCYFDRAVRFAPNDHIVRVLYARMLARTQRKPDAVRQLEAASSLAAESGFAQNNIGLVYADMNELDKALEHAHRAHALGFNRPELRQRLEKVGRWREPAAVAAAAPASAASSQ